MKSWVIRWAGKMGMRPSPGYLPEAQKRLFIRAETNDWLSADISKKTLYLAIYLLC